MLQSRWRRGAGAGILLGSLASASAAVEVRFEINDAQVRGRPVAGARVLVAAEADGEPVAADETGAAGIAVLDLEPGTYWVTYLAAGYIPIRDSETEIRGAGQVITTTLSRLLEAELGAPTRRVRLVLNWGSRSDDARDVDGHAECACGQADAHVYYAAMRHEVDGHSLELDVDDMNWGGPETITLRDPPPGSYAYRVHQYSRDRGTLGESDLVVRVFFDDRLAAELKGPAYIERHWVPFKEIVVGPDLEPRLVLFDAREIAAGEDRVPPAEPYAEQGRGISLRTCAMLAIGLFVLSILAYRAVKKRRRARAGRRSR